MSFEIHQFSRDGLDITEITNTLLSTRLQILPSSGALWHGWILEKEGVQLNLINNYRDGAELGRELDHSYKSAKLSPFACRIPEGKYTFDGQPYEFAHKFSDGNAIHGLLFNKYFVQGDTRQDDTRASISFKYAYRGDDPGYPFDYDCAVTYTLEASGRVTLDTTVQNRTASVIPLADGWHPYFRTGTRINDCHLQFKASRLVEFDDKLIPTGRFLPYDAFLKEREIGDTTLDNCFLLDMEDDQPRCTLYDPRQNIHIHIYPSQNYPVLQVYTPPDRKSIAIETLSGAPDAFNNGIGLVLLDPGESKTFSASFEAVWE